MAVSETASMSPVMAFALVGALGVGSQWLAWKLRLPAIVLMLSAGLIVGPGLGVFDPARDIGPLVAPMIAIAVAIILFEGGLTLNFRSLQDAAKGVQRLVLIGAPLGWLLSAAALHWVVGLSWASSTVFGGIMIVTGPTVIAPLLRQARLKRRPAALLQWEAIVNDPVGALAAVLALEVVLVLQTTETRGEAFWDLSIGIGFAVALGLAGGVGMAWAFRRGKVPEYMKVPVLFVVLLAVFAVSDFVLHESGLLAVTIMGLWIANAGLPSFEELRRFKEHATVLLVSGVFILLAAGTSLGTLEMLGWRSALFIVVVILAVRPATVLISLAFSNIPWKERILVAFTGPRGVVLVAVAGLFGERLVAQGVDDAALIGPLAFALVAGTVVLHGFTLTPIARVLGVTASDTPGVLIVGGAPWSVAFGQLLEKLELPVLIADPNHAHLRAARRAGLKSYFGDVLSEAAEHSLDFVRYQKVIAATDNDAYNTLVCTGMAHDFGRESVFQPVPVRQETARHALPATLGGRILRGELSYFEANRRIHNGWHFRATGLTEEFTLDDWLDKNPEALPMAEYDGKAGLRLLDQDAQLKAGPGDQLIALYPPDPPEESAQRH
ncbi:cation:proton antiporter [Pontibaca salina]|uniref:Sodium:proton antiporter n=1 Tax=Pontibaca salina TaxID=2795731 RepID=A0A934M0K1_9RHOB|nr:sodium:proton antiporter [Pontibaca salina]MBI6629818.1 sodium:proton antiporter [Pontibaca salina]